MANETGSGDQAKPTGRLRLSSAAIRLLQQYGAGPGPGQAPSDLAIEALRRHLAGEAGADPAGGESPAAEEARPDSAT